MPTRGSTRAPRSTVQHVAVAEVGASSTRATPKRAAASRKRKQDAKHLDITAGAQVHETNDTCCSICTPVTDNNPRCHNPSQAWTTRLSPPTRPWWMVATTRFACRASATGYATSLKTRSARCASAPYEGTRTVMASWDVAHPSVQGCRAQAPPISRLSCSTTMTFRAHHRSPRRAASFA